MDSLPMGAAAHRGASVSAPDGSRRRVRAVKIYDEVRTAHLERMGGGEAATILYRQRRYDFDESLARGVDVRRAGVAGVFWWTLRHPVEVAEINEPLMAGAAPRSLAAVAGNRLGGLLRGGGRARVVTYAIENLDPAEAVSHLPWRAAARRRLLTLLVPMVWGSLDRIAFGTELAVQLHRRCFAGRWPEHRLVPALPASALAQREDVVRDARVLFLGDLSVRKGFPDVVAAWQQLRAERTDIRLVIVGSGQGEADARALAAADERVELHVNPPRATVLEILASSKVVVLPARRTPLWREQVGLPIVEGLAHGCEVVASTETGLAPWLAAHGHGVAAPADVAGIRVAVSRALASTRTPTEIVADLPAADGRAAAEAWLFEGAP